MPPRLPIAPAPPLYYPTPPPAADVQQYQAGFTLDLSQLTGFPGGASDFLNADGDFVSVVTSPDWADITSKPTTIAGYGITDAYTESEIDAFLAALNLFTARTTTNFATGSLVNGTSELGSVNIGRKAGALVVITADRACRVRLYATQAARDAAAEVARALGTTAQAGIGLLAEFGFAGSGTIDVSPVAIVANDEGTPASRLWYNITNLSGSTASVTVGLDIVPMDFAASAVTVDWSDVTGTPTTLGGYGITDAYTKTAADARYAAIAGPFPWADITGQPTTVAGYGITTTDTPQFLRMGLGVAAASNKAFKLASDSATSDQIELVDTNGTPKGGWVIGISSGGSYDGLGFYSEGTVGLKMKLLTAGGLQVVDGVGFYNTAPTTKKSVTGSRGGNAALASLLTQLAAYGLLTDSTSA